MSDSCRVNLYYFLESKRSRVSEGSYEYEAVNRNTISRLFNQWCQKGELRAVLYAGREGHYIEL